MDEERFSRANALRESGRMEEALEEFRRMAEASNDCEERALVRLSEARTLAALGRRAEAERAVREADRLFASDSAHRPELVLFQAELDAGAGREGKQRALIRLERLLEDLELRLAQPAARAACARVRARRGGLLHALGRPRAARAVFEEARALDAPKDASFYYEFGRCCYRLGEFARAEMLLGEALSRGVGPAEQAEAHYLIAMVNVRRGAYAQAVNDLARAEAAQEPRPDRRENTLLWLAWLSARLGQKKEAEEYLRRAEASRPGEARWRHSLRRIVYRLQRRGLALVLHPGP
jgi:tetratricopeptide (TPR) repeat protein